MLLLAEPGSQEGPEQVERELQTDDLRTEADDVDVVVLDRLMRRVDVVAERGADAVDLVGGDTGADTGPADENRPVCRVVEDPGADGPRDVREIDRFVGVRAESATS